MTPQALGADCGRRRTSSLLSTLHVVSSFRFCFFASSFCITLSQEAHGSSVLKGMCSADTRNFFKFCRSWRHDRIFEISGM